LLAAVVLTALALAPLASALAADVTITKQGDDFLIATPVYQACIDGKTGMLARMTIDGGVVVEKTAINLENRKIGQVAVSQEGPARVVAIVSAEDNKKMVDKALRVAYEAEGTILYMKVLGTVGQIAGRGPIFELGKEVQMARSLEFKETIPMPTGQGRAPWVKVKFYYANGATLGILSEGPGNPLNPNENGGVGGDRYARGGFVANSEYVYTLVAERGTKKTLGAPPMEIAEARTPAVFWQGQPVQASLKIARKDCAKLAGLDKLRIKYEVQDVLEKPAAKGERPLDLSGTADPILVQVPLGVSKLGWYRAYLTVNDAADSLLEGRERLIFSVLKHDPNMGERFDNQIQTDYTIGLGLIREGASDDLKRLAEIEANAKGTDVNVSFAIDGSPVGNDPKKFGEYVFKLFDKVKDRIQRVEIINEPNGRMQPKEYVDTFLRPAFENIRKASPNTKVLSPVMCGIGNDEALYLKDLYKLGLKDLCDELTFHPYAGNFDDGAAIENMQRLQEIIAANGDAAKPVHFTEAGYFHGGWSDMKGLREIVKLAVSQYAWQNAAMGIDHRHNFYYFTDIMGYYDMWLRATQLTPAAVALRTYTSLVKGQQRPTRLDFGSLEVVRGFVYGGPQRQVVLLWTSNNNAPSEQPDVTTEVAIATDAPAVQWLDCFGNPMPAEVKDGKCTLTVGSFPSYLIVPAKAKVAAVPQRWGTNLALAALGATAESTSEQGTSPAVSAIDRNTASDPCWRNLTPNELPQSLTVTLAGPASVDRVGLWSYCARGYDLEAMGSDGQWVKLASRRDQPRLRFRNETFKPLVTDQVRLTIVDSYTDRAEVAEMQVFSPAAPAAGGAAAAQTAELVNWALAANGATARASSEMSKEVTFAEQDWGAKKPRILKIKIDAKAANAIDGKRLVANWREFFPTTWMAAPGSELPQWLEVTFAGPKKITSVAVYTIAFATWTPATSGVRDWDVQVWDAGAWRTVDSVTGNTRVSRITRLKTPVTTDKIRILVKATNDPEGTVGLMEVQAFGPAK
jgi:hypothetical protein